MHARQRHTSAVSAAAPSAGTTPSAALHLASASAVSRAVQMRRDPTAGPDLGARAALAGSVGGRIVMMRAGSGAAADSATVHAAADEGVRGSGGTLPHADRIQAAFGRHDVSGVEAYVGGAAATASARMGARAYATGDKVAFRDGPDLHTAAHEAAHVVQQRGGVQLKSGVGQSGDAYEQHADAVADTVVRGGSAESLLDRMAGGGGGGGAAVQRAVQRDETATSTSSAGASGEATTGAAATDPVERVRTLLSYSETDWVVTDAEATRALGLLGAMSRTQLRAALRSLGDELCTRLLDNLPAEARSGESFTKVLVAMGPTRILPYVRDLLSLGAFDWVVTDEEATAVVELASALRPDQQRSLLRRLGGRLRERLADNIPAAAMNDASTPAPASSGASATPRGAEAATMTAPSATTTTSTTPATTPATPAAPRMSGRDSFLLQLGAMPRGVMGAHQLSRVRPAVEALSDADYRAFRALVDAETSVHARAFLFKALAAGNSVADIRWLAGEIAGHDLDWLLDNCTTGDTNRSGSGTRQQYSHTCGVTTVQTLRGEYDPVYALRLHRNNTDINDVNASNGATANPSMATEQRSMHTTAYGGTGHGAHTGVLASRNNSASGGGRWVDDWLNSLSRTTGLRYTTQSDPGAASAIATLRRTVGAGMQTPVVIGNGAGQYTHYILAMHTRTRNGKTEFQFHDPWDGVTVWRSEDDIRNGTMNIANSNQITALEVPARAP